MEQRIRAQLPDAVILNLKRLLGVLEYILDLFDQVEDAVELELSAFGRLIFRLLRAQSGKEVAQNAGLCLIVAARLLLVSAEWHLFILVDELVKGTNLCA